ncbi:MAG TPA: hypothetical protein VGM56_25660 [Byssovorax sp.]|jgi:hypothetical protein
MFHRGLDAAAAALAVCGATVMLCPSAPPSGSCSDGSPGSSGPREVDGEHAAREPLVSLDHALHAAREHDVTERLAQRRGERVVFGERVALAP